MLFIVTTYLVLRLFNKMSTFYSIRTGGHTFLLVLYSYYHTHVSRTNELVSIQT